MQNCWDHNLVVKMKGLLMLLIVLHLSIEEQCSSKGHCTVLAVPASVCGNAEVNTPVCNAVRAIRFCSNISVDIGGQNGESYLAEIATEGAADGSVQLVVMSSQVVGALAKHAFLSGTVIARAIVKLTQQFGWSRLTIVADIADPYFLHTAEEFYRMANLSSDSRLLQLRNSDSEINNLVNRVDSLNLKIIVLSLRPHLVSKLLCRASEKHLVWPQYAWIVHSVELSEEGCGDNSTLDGVITLKLKDTLSTDKQHHRNCDCIHRNCDCLTENKVLQNIDARYLNSCRISSFLQQEVVFQQVGQDAFYSNETGKAPHPSDFPPLYIPTVFLALFYVATSTCFVICTISLVLYVYFRNEPAIKATSVSLSILIFIGCYLMILYLYILNSDNILSSYGQNKALKDRMCISLIWLNGIAYPTLILSTLLVKLLRVYRLFSLQTRVSKLTTSNLALAVYVLLMTSPNALVSLLWTATDPFISADSFLIRNGFSYNTEPMCTSKNTLKWLLVQLIYTLILSLFLIAVAISTRKIKFQDFKDTKKVSVLSFLVVFICTCGLFYWYLLSYIQADTILIQSVLQFAHYGVILSCQGFLFAPKLFPIVKGRVLRRYYRALNRPCSKDSD